MTNSNDPISYVQEFETNVTEDGMNIYTKPNIGLTKRELMSTELMAALLSNSNLSTHETFVINTIARQAVLCTDILISELNKPLSNDPNRVPF